WQNSFCVLPLLFHTSINENINCRVVMSVELSIALLFSSKTIPSASSLKYVLYRWVTLEPQTSLPDLHTTEFEYKKKAQEAVALESQGIIVPAGVAKPRMVNGLHV